MYLLEVKQQTLEKHWQDMMSFRISVILLYYLRIYEYYSFWTVNFIKYWKKYIYNLYWNGCLCFHQIGILEENVIKICIDQQNEFE